MSNDSNSPAAPAIDDTITVKGDGTPDVIGTVTGVRMDGGVGYTFIAYALDAAPTSRRAKHYARAGRAYAGHIYSAAVGEFTTA